MIVHQIDGTYELFRHCYGQRRFDKGKDKPFGAVTGVLHTVLETIESGAKRERQARNSLHFQGKIASWFAVP